MLANNPMDDTDDERIEQLTGVVRSYIDEFDGAEADDLRRIAIEIGTATRLSYMLARSSCAENPTDIRGFEELAEIFQEARTKIEAISDDLDLSQADFAQLNKVISDIGDRIRMLDELQNLELDIEGRLENADAIAKEMQAANDRKNPLRNGGRY